MYNIFAQQNIIYLLIVVVISTCAYTLLQGSYSKRVFMDNKNLWLFNTLCNLFTLVFIFLTYLITTGLGTFSLFSIISGAVFGLAVVFCTYITMYTYTIGPLSYTTVIISLSTVITALSGIFYGQTLTVTQIIGVLFMIACFILSPEKQKGESKASAKWLIVCIIATMLTGALGLIQTFHQKSDFRTEMPCMLITCFVVCVIVSFMFFLFTKSTLPESAVNVVKRRNRRLIIILSVLSGLTYSVCHVFNLYLAGALPTVIMFPVVNLVPMILTVIIGKIMFKEKLSFKRWTGIVIGILSTVLLSGFIDSLIK